MMPNSSTNLKPKTTTMPQLEPRIIIHNHQLNQPPFQAEEALPKKIRKSQEMIMTTMMMPTSRVTIMVPMITTPTNQELNIQELNLPKLMAQPTLMMPISRPNMMEEMTITPILQESIMLVLLKRKVTAQPTLMKPISRLNLTEEMTTMPRLVELIMQRA